MLKTIRKFVVERRRLVRQRRQQVIGEANSGYASSHSEVVPRQEEDNSDPSRHSEVPPRLAEPELEGSSGLAARAQVKWFNPNKGYGFVQLSDGSGDAFLHVTRPLAGRGAIGSVRG